MTKKDHHVAGRRMGFVLSSYSPAKAPMVCSAATLCYAGGKRTDIHYNEISIEYSRLNPRRLYWGFETGAGMNMATPEKALADLAYLRKDIPFADELDLDLLNMEELDRISSQYPKTTKHLLETHLYRHTH